MNTKTNLCCCPFIGEKRKISPFYMCFVSASVFVRDDSILFRFLRFIHESCAVKNDLWLTSGWMEWILVVRVLSRVFFSYDKKTNWPAAVWLAAWFDVLSMLWMAARVFFSKQEKLFSWPIMTLILIYQPAVPNFNKLMESIILSLTISQWKKNIVLL